MSILDSQIAPYLILVTIFASLLGFFRKKFFELILLLIVEIAFFALFPQLLVQLSHLIIWIRSNF